MTENCSKYGSQNIYKVNKLLQNSLQQTKIFVFLGSMKWVNNLPGDCTLPEKTQCPKERLEIAN